MYAKNILNNRYGKKEIAIDNFLCEYNDEVISLEQFKTYDSEKVSIILCASGEANALLKEELVKGGYKAKIINLREVVIEKHPEKLCYFKEVTALLNVKKVKNHNLIRIGSQQDGGYIMIDDFDKIEVAYSFGIDKNIDWENDIVNKGIEVYCFDPSISGTIVKHNKMHFSRIGISGEDDANLPYRKLETLVKENGHETLKNMILKIDVEGAEWDSLDNISPTFLAQFAQISLELHNITDMSNSTKILKCLNNITTSHQAVWIHGNNAGKLEEAGEIKCPQLLEVTLVNKALYNFEDCEYICPMPLDAPNLMNSEDIVISKWNG